MVCIFIFFDFFFIVGFILFFEGLLFVRILFFEQEYKFDKEYDLFEFFNMVVESLLFVLLVRLICFFKGNFVIVGVIIIIGLGFSFL